MSEAPLTCVTYTQCTVYASSPSHLGLVFNARFALLKEWKLYDKGSRTASFLSAPGRDKLLLQRRTKGKAVAVYLVLLGHILRSLKLQIITSSLSEDGLLGVMKAFLL